MDEDTSITVSLDDENAEVYVQVRGNKPLPTLPEVRKHLGFPIDNLALKQYIPGSPTPEAYFEDFWLLSADETLQQPEAGK